MYSSLNYTLDKAKIALRPVIPYHDAKLLVINRSNVNSDSAKFISSTFLDIDKFLPKNSVIIFNNTKVNKSRIFGSITNTTSLQQKEVEFLLIKTLEASEIENANLENVTYDKKPQSFQLWQCMARPLKKLKEGVVVEFKNSSGEIDLRAVILKRVSEYEVSVKFELTKNNLDKNIELIMQEHLLMPIPPYIRDGVADKQDEIDYQTIFAKHSGSIAAPTASLHFTEDVMLKIKDINLKIEYATLHVGVSSIRTVYSEEDNKGEVNLKNPGFEKYLADVDLKQRLIEYRKEGRKIIAVGTTVARAIESLYSYNESSSKMIETDLFITPGYKFIFIDGLVTNFHFPASTHLLLVESFIGRELLEASYEYALSADYRFLSYGDGMLII